MHFAQLAHHKNDQGSAVVGFSLIAPLVALVFVGVVAVASILGQRVVLSAAASSGARMAATLGANYGQVHQQVDQVLNSYSLNPHTVKVRIWRSNASGVPTMNVQVSRNLVIPWVNHSIEISATSHRIDENL